MSSRNIRVIEDQAYTLHEGIIHTRLARVERSIGQITNRLEEKYNE